METSGTSGSSSAGVAAVHELLAGMARAWARGDGAGYAAAFSQDARYVTISGQRIVGRSAIAVAHQRLFDSVFRGSRLDVEDPVEVQRVAPDVVVLHGRGTVSVPDGTARVRPGGLLTMVAARDGEGWRFVSFSNTPTSTGQEATA